MNLIAGLISVVLGIALSLISLAVVAVVAYFVIKKAVKDALREHEQQKGLYDK